MSAPSLPKHHATKAGGEKRPVFICAECLVLWPCLDAHMAVTRCSVCGKRWSEHPKDEYRFGCTAARRL